MTRRINQSHVIVHDRTRLTAGPLVRVAQPPRHRALVGAAMLALIVGAAIVAGWLA